MRWLHILLVMTMLIMLLVGGAITILVTLPSETLKPIVEKIVTAAIDRTFIFEGNLEVNLGHRITVRADRVKMANAAWSSRPYMLDVEQTYVVLDAWALTRGQVLLRDARVNSAMLLFEENSAGTLNWDLGGDDSDDDADDEPMTSIPLLLEQAELKDVSIELDLPAFKKPVRIQVDSAKQVNGEDDILDLVIAGSVNDRMLSIKGYIGPFTTLLVGLDVDFDIDVTGDDLTLKTKGHIDDLFAPKKPEFELDLKGADASKLSALLGVRKITRGSVSLRARMKPAGDAFKATIDGDLGEFLIDLSAELKALNTVDGLKLELQASGPDLGVAGAIAGVSGLPPDAFVLTGQVEESDGKLSIKEMSLTAGENVAKLDGVLPAFPGFKDASLTVGLKGPNFLQFQNFLGLPDAPEALVVPFGFSGELQPSAQGTEIFDVSVTLGELSAKANGTVTDYPDFIGTRFDLDASGPNIHFVTKVFGVKGLPVASFDVKGKVEITGKGLQIHRSDFRVGKNTASVVGLIGRKPLLRDSDLKFSGSGPNLADVLSAELFGELDIPASPFEISAGLGISNSRLSVQQLKFTGARGRISGDIELALDDITSAGRFSLQAKGADLDEMIPSTSQFKPASVPFEVSTKGEWSKEKLSVEYMDIKIADATFNLQGKLYLPPDMQASAVVLSAKGPSMASLGNFDGLSLPDKPFDLDAELGGDVYTLHIKHLSAHVGDSDLIGQLHLDIKDKPTATVKFTSQKMDLAQFLPKPAKQAAGGKTIKPATPDQPSGKKADEKPDDKSAEKTDSYARLIPDIPVPFDALNSFDLTLNADADIVIHPSLTLVKFDLDAKLEDGDLSVEKWSADAKQGHFVAQLDLKTDADTAKLSISLDSRDLVLAMGNVSDADAEKYPPSSISLKMSASGASSRELVASLNGYADMRTKKGSIRNNIALNLSGGIFTELLSLLNPYGKKVPYTEIQCGVYFIDVADGIVTFDPGAVLQTDKINIFSMGSVNLNTEKLDVNFNTAARSGSGISAAKIVNPFIRIGGSLAEPKLKLDMTSSAVQGSAAVATAGMSIVAKGLWGRWFAAKDPCAKFIEEAEKAGRPINVVE